MTADLVEIYERIEIARGDIKELSGLCQKFFREAFRLDAVPTLIAAERDIYISITQPVPTAIKVKAGTIINELRSSLDSLACILAIRNNKSTAGTYFPVSKSHAIFLDDGMYKIRKLSKEDQDKIIALNPYREKHPLLYALHKADNERKHIRLAASGCSANGISLGPGLIRLQSCNYGDLRGSVLNGIKSPNLEYWNNLAVDVGVPVRVIAGLQRAMTVRIEPALVFSGIEELEGEVLIPTLENFAHLVTIIVGKFDGSPSANHGHSGKGGN